jgi:hypothetical protein
MRAVQRVEAYIQQCGLEKRLIELVKMRFAERPGAGKEHPDRHRCSEGPFPLLPGSTKVLFVGRYPMGSSGRRGSCIRRSNGNGRPRRCGLSGW